MTPPNFPKRPLRAHFRQILESAEPAQLHKWNQALGGQLLKLSQAFPAGGFVAAYRARPKEANPEALWALPFRFCFPRVLAADQLEFRLVPNARDDSAFREGYRGILEPLDSQVLVAREQISVCLVPLLAFDAKGGRLGHGKGHYDRFLSGFSGLKIGIGFECQFSVQPLPMDLYDQRMDMVVSEALIRDFRAR